ncbi:hypothetical protein YC2023_002349 [Brassica napus]
METFPQLFLQFISSIIGKGKLAKYTNKGGISLNGGKMVMLGGRKLEGYRVWSANRRKVVCHLQLIDAVTFHRPRLRFPIVEPVLRDIKALRMQVLT